MIDDIDKLRAVLSRAIARTHGENTFEDILEGITQGRLQLITCGNSAAVIERLRYPRATATNIFLTAGNLDEVLKMDAAFVQIAKARGDRCIKTLESRPGWRRVLEPLGYKFAGVHLTKEIT